jgi:hypothetical protein
MFGDSQIYQFLCPCFVKKAPSHVFSKKRLHFLGQKFESSKKILQIWACVAKIKRIFVIETAVERLLYQKKRLCEGFC